MSQRKLISSGVRALLVGCGVVYLLFSAQSAQGLLVPFLLAVFFAVVIHPGVAALERRKVPTWLAATLVLAGLMVPLLLLSYYVGGTLDRFTNRLPFYEERVRTELMDLTSQVKLPQVLDQNITVDDLLGEVELSSALSLAAGVLTSFSSAFGNFLLILATVFFMLLEASSLPDKIRSAFGAKSDTLDYLRRVTRDIKRYLSIKTVVSLATGALIGLWALIIGVDFALLWAILGFLLNYVPNIGSVLAAIPAVLLALVQLGPSGALYLAAGYVLINLVLANLVEPRLMGRGLGLSTLVVFVSLVFWGWLLGPVGMFLSAPLTMVIKIAMERRPSTRWIAVLLGPSPDDPTSSLPPDTTAIAVPVAGVVASEEAQS
ncbi:MAG: AI-2E family transporter [Acidobacteriota bacterium]